MEQDSQHDLDVLTEIIASLKKLSKDDQKRTLQTVATFLELHVQGINDLPSGHSGSSCPAVEAPHAAGALKFSENRDISPKDFMHEKAPRTDIERVACLGYYLTHYRNTPHFKTLDISTLNTEAAQPKFSSASVAVDNATKSGLFVQAVKGNKQISSAGEIYVQYLPDREAAKECVKDIRSKRKPRKPKLKKRVSTQK
jgi:hypothetical protein